MKKYKKIFFIITIVLVLFTGFILGRYFWPISNIVISKQIRENSSEYKFINPLLLVSNINTGRDPKYKSITDTLTDYVNKKISQKKAEDISIYFRDLNSGLYSGVNEDHLYSPASMLKVAMLIECLRLNESDPSFFNKKIYMSSSTESFDANQFYIPKHQVVSGRVYTVKELLNYMIVDSDNNAMVLLNYLMGGDKTNDLLRTLQLPVPDSGTEDFISPQLYSRIYRILYNSTYLSPSVSEGALELLTGKNFPQGIDSGVPEKINVAEKFGERTNGDQLGNVTDRELHDCGIVYFPDSPYFLCVMTKGQDFTQLQIIISDVSKMVWDFFSSVNN